MTEQRWLISIGTPVGQQGGTLRLRRVGAGWVGEAVSGTDTMPVDNIQWDGDRLRWELRLPPPIGLKVQFDVRVDGDRLAGRARVGLVGSPLSGRLLRRVRGG